MSNTIFIIKISILTHSSLCIVKLSFYQLRSYFYCEQRIFKILKSLHYNNDITETQIQFVLSKYHL